MSRTKVRKIEYRPDEYIAGVGGQLGAEEQAVYWMACSLIMSKGGPIDDDAQRLAHLCKLRPSKVRRILDALVAKYEKLSRIDGKLAHDRVEYDLEKSRNRIEKATENGLQGGRPPKEINEEEKPAGFQDAKANHQPSTSNASSGGGGERTVKWTADTDGGLIVEWFEERRLELWPTESGLPAARLTQLTLARGFLDLGISRPALIELIDRQMIARQRSGQRAPTSIKAFHRSLAEGIAQALAAKKKPDLPTATAGASNGQRGVRSTGHGAFVDAAAEFIAGETGRDPRTGEGAGDFANDGRSVRHDDLGGAVSPAAIGSERRH